MLLECHLILLTPWLQVGFLVFIFKFLFPAPILAKFSLTENQGMQAERRRKLKFLAVAKSWRPWQIATEHDSLKRSEWGCLFLLTVVSGCLLPLQLRLHAFAPGICFQDHLCWYVCLGRHVFAKWKLKFSRIIMAIRCDICSEIWAWNSWLFGLRAHLEMVYMSSKINH